MTSRARPQPRPWIDRAAPLVAMAGVLLLYAGASIRKIDQADFWWQDATGAHVAAHGPPVRDPFSYSVPDRTWIEPRWLFCLGLHALNASMGPGAVVAAASLVLGAALALAAASAGARARPVAAAAVMAVAVLAGRGRFLARPEALSLLFLAIDLAIIERHRRCGGRIIALLPAVQALWANVHSLSVIGLFVTGAYLAVEAARAGRARGGPSGSSEAAPAESRSRPIALAFAGVLLAGFATPYGLRGFLFPFLQLTYIGGTAFKEAITEFRSPFAYASYYEPIAWYVALAALCLLGTLASLRRLDPFRLAVCAATFLLSLLAVRNILLFVLAAAAFLVDLLARAPEPGGGSARRGAARAAFAAAIALFAFGAVTAVAFATNRYYVSREEPTRFGFGISEHAFPAESARLAEAPQTPDPIFSTMSESSYLIGRGRRVFFDPRLELYGEDFFRRYLRIIGSAEGWRAGLAEYGFRAALVEITSAELIARILDEGSFRLAALDEHAVLLVRRADGLAAEPDTARAAATAAVLAGAIERLRRRLPAPRPWGTLSPFESAVSPIPYVQVAHLLATLGAPERAEPFYRDALAAFPGSARTRVGYAQALDAGGDAAGARREYEAALARGAKDVELATALGYHLIETGRADRALGLLRRAVKARPRDALAWALPGEARHARGESAEAIACLERAVALEPANPQFAGRLAVVRQAAGARPAERPGGGG